MKYVDTSNKWMILSICLYLPNLLNKLLFETTYDLSGNMTSDANKGIQSITYNYLNLPTKVVFVAGSKYIDYTYDALGTKLKKIVRNGGTTITTEYNDGFIYGKVNSGANNLQFFETAVGYIAKDNLSGNYSYVYNYTDQNGNVRLSFTKDGVNQLRVIEENNYYPFGLKHKGY